MTTNSPPDVLLNPRWRAANSQKQSSPPSDRSRAFHRQLDGYAPTPLLPLARAAIDLPVRQVAVKHEHSRLGLPAYKVLGGSWAVHEAIRTAAGLPDDVVLTLPELRAAAATAGAPTLCTATDGNHGRGIAVMAEQLRLACDVFVPHDMVAERADAIASHGATVHRVSGGYDDAVAAAASFVRAEPNRWLCADTAGPSDDDATVRFAREVQRGYYTMFAEVLDAAFVPDLVIVPCGVGALAASAVDYFAMHAPAARIVTAEPIGSACVLAALHHDAPTLVGDPPSIMAGLRAAMISSVAWPTLRTGLAGAVAVTDDEAMEAMRMYAGQGIEAGESGAASLAGLLRFYGKPAVPLALGLTAESRVLLLNTEGPTDRGAWSRIVDAKAS
jgi:diaminopropionate ammonia-lyase